MMRQTISLCAHAAALVLKGLETQPAPGSRAVGQWQFLAEPIALSFGCSGGFVGGGCGGEV